MFVCWLLDALDALGGLEGLEGLDVLGFFKSGAKLQLFFDMCK